MSGCYYCAAEAAPDAVAPAFLGAEIHSKIDQKVSLGREFSSVSELDGYLREKSLTPVSSERERKQVRDALKVPKSKITMKEVDEALDYASRISS